AGRGGPGAARLERAGAVAAGRSVVAAAAGSPAVAAGYRNAAAHSGPDRGRGAAECAAGAGVRTAGVGGGAVGVRSRGGTSRRARPLWPEHARAVRAAGAATDRERRATGVGELAQR